MHFERDTQQVNAQVGPVNPQLQRSWQAIPCRLNGKQPDSTSFWCYSKTPQRQNYPLTIALLLLCSISVEKHNEKGEFFCSAFSFCRCLIINWRRKALRYSSSSARKGATGIEAITLSATDRFSFMGLVLENNNKASNFQKQELTTQLQTKNGYSSGLCLYKVV